MLKSLLAPNPSPMTLTGTWTYVIGRQRAVVIDPGPDDAAHLDAIAQHIGDGVLASILLTHHHPDHDAGAEALSARLGAGVRSGRVGLVDDLRIETDAGELIALYTPGHTGDHFSFWWPAERAVFCGDLMMGGLDTALVAPPEGDLTLYLQSLERLRALGARTIYPAHGPPFDDPPKAIERYQKHRQDREAQVLQGLAGAPSKTEDELMQDVYGSALDPALVPYARAAIDAYLQHLNAMGRIKRGHAGWERTL